MSRYDRQQILPQIGRIADVLLSQVRGGFIIAQFTHGARITNDILGLIADLLRDLDSMEAILNAGGQP